jgi:hypothetical protein
MSEKKLIEACTGIKSTAGGLHRWNMCKSGTGNLRFWDSRAVRSRMNRPAPAKMGKQQNKVEEEIWQRRQRTNFCMITTRME